MKTSLVKLNGGWMFVRHTPILQSQRTILCIHGIGESSLSFLESFQVPSLQSFNVVAPDLMGYGCSSNAPDEDYSFSSQIQRLYKLIDELGLAEFVLVGHSMGGDIVTYFAANDPARVRGLINIEGNLTPSDVLISNQAVKADERGDFETWFREDFMNNMVLNQWGSKWASCKRYYASLWFCRPQAFLSNAREICQRNTALPNTPETETGLKFQQIEMPKVYCWGGNISEETKKLIDDKRIRDWGFEDAFHWPMIDKAKEFYRLLAQFCSEI
jgi:pimeloyl-ACP methyl ester carboxylesterase